MSPRHQRRALLEDRPLCPFPVSSKPRVFDLRGAIHLVRGPISILRNRLRGYACRNTTTQKNAVLNDGIKGNEAAVGNNRQHSKCSSTKHNGRCQEDHDFPPVVNADANFTIVTQQITPGSYVAWGETWNWIYMASSDLQLRRLAICTRFYARGDI